LNPAPCVDRTTWRKWLVKFVDRVESLNAPAEFVDLVHKLTVFEGLMGHPEGQVSSLGMKYPSKPSALKSFLQRKENVLSKVDRPSEIDRWINGGRKATPKIIDLAGFIGNWRKWWVHLQPESREKRKLRRIVQPGEAWEELRKGGVNGVFNVVVSLSWWSAVSQTATQQKAFHEMVEDVSWVLDEMIRTVDHASKKRASDDSGLDDAAKKRKRCVLSDYTGQVG
jgi:hypothetical protein